MISKILKLIFRVYNLVTPIQCSKRSSKVIQKEKTSFNKFPQCNPQNFIKFPISNFPKIVFRYINWETYFPKI